MDNYQLSNLVEQYDAKEYKIKAVTKRLFKRLYNSDTLTQSDLNKLSDAICKDFKVNNVPITFKGKQPKSKRSIVKGFYSVSKPMLNNTYIGLGINVYKLTATRQKQVTNKVAIDVLLHELTHHFDYQIIGLSKSIHSKGFYKRINYLKTLLQ